MGTTTYYIVLLIFNIVMAAICWKIAGSKGRSQPLWGVLGFFFPIISLIVLLIVGNKKTV